MRKTKWLDLLVLSITAFLILLPSLNFGFVNLDDNFYVTDDIYIRHFSVTNIKHFFTSFHHGVYAPIQYITYMLTYSIVDYHAWLYHLINILFYILSAWFVYLVIKKIQDNRAVAFISTLLFLVSPVNIDTAVWIAELKNSQSLLFFLISFYSYIIFREKMDTNSFYKAKLSGNLQNNEGLEKVKLIDKGFTHYAKWWYLFSIVSFVAALLVKPPSETVVLMMFLYDTLIKGKSAVDSFKKLLPFFILCIPFTVVYMIGQSTIGSYHGLIRGSLWAQIKTIISVIAGVFNYPVKLFLPVNLSVAYPIDANITSVNFILSLAVILLIIIMVNKLLKENNKLTIFWILWYFVNMLPYYGIIAMPFFANWYLYVPSIGLYTLFINSAINVKNKKLLYALVCFILLIFGFMGFNRQFIWKNDINMWKSSLESVGNDPYIIRNLAVSYFKNNDIKRGIMYGEALLSKTPDFVMMKYLIGKGYADLHEYNKAQEVLNKAIVQLQSLNKNGRANLAVMPGLGDSPDQLMAMLYTELGDINLSNGDFNQAISMYKKAISTYPCVHAYDMLAFIYLKLNHINEAKTILQEIVTKSPNESESWRMLGYVMAEYYNNKELAIKYFEKSLEIEPNQTYASEMRHFIKIWKTNK